MQWWMYTYPIGRVHPDFYRVICRQRNVLNFSHQSMPSLCIALNEPVTFDEMQYEQQSRREMIFNVMMSLVCNELSMLW